LEEKGPIKNDIRFELHATPFHTTVEELVEKKKRLRE
jgi:hypothetical protein